MIVVIHPLLDPRHEIDVTQRLVAVIAEELWRLYGGNEHLNWIEAESQLRQIVGETPSVAGREPSTEDQWVGAEAHGCAEFLSDVETEHWTPA